MRYLIGWMRPKRTDGRSEPVASPTMETCTRADVRVRSDSSRTAAAKDSPSVLDLARGVAAAGMAAYATNANNILLDSATIEGREDMV